MGHRAGDRRIPLRKRALKRADTPWQVRSARTIVGMLFVAAATVLSALLIGFAWVRIAGTFATLLR